MKVIRETSWFVLIMILVMLLILLLQAVRIQNIESSVNSIKIMLIK
jgi:predicted ferric reductase